MLDVFRDAALNCKIEANTRPEKKFQATILAEMMAIDSTCPYLHESMGNICTISVSYEVAALHILEEYLPSRIIDSGELYVSTVALFLGQ